MRIEKLKQEFEELLDEFGSTERNFAERRKMLRQLRDLEQEMDKYYEI